MSVRVSGALLAAVFALSLVCALPAVAGPSAQWLRQATRRTFTSRDGSISGAVRAILQTRDGYVWIGSSSGLARFDGVRFVTFDRRNVPEMPDSHVTSLAEDPGGVLWIATRGGVLTYRDGTFRAIDAPIASATVLQPDRRGGVYVGGPKGLHYVSDGKATPVGPAQGVPEDSVLSLWLSPSNVLWIGTAENGVLRFENGRGTAIASGKSWEGRAFSIAGDSNGERVWFATVRGLLEWRERGKQLEQVNRSALLAITASPDGTVWGLQTDGNMMVAENGTAALSTLFGRRVRLFEGCVLRDREGNLWVGHEYGLDFFSESRFQQHGTPEGLADDVILSIARRRGGGLFVGTEFGLHLFQSSGDVERVITQKDGLRDSAVFSVLEDPNGDLYVGSAAGLTTIRGGRYRVHDAKDFGAVFALHRDRAGQLWLGTHFGGVLRWNADGTYRTFSTSQGLADREVYSLTSDARGVLWVGTRSGLSAIEDGRVQTIRPEEGGIREQVTSLLIDSRKGLWIGSSRGLLHRTARGGIVRIDGLPGDNAGQLQEDDRGNLWMNTDRGVMRVPLSDLYGYVNREQTHVRAVLLTQADGLRRAGAMEMGQKAEGIAPARDIVFATRGGLVRLSEKALRPDESMPPARIEEMRADGAPVAPAPGVKVGPGAQRIEFQFTGLGFAAAERLRFRHRLEGFDRRWVDAGSGRTATYTNLVPGTYTFQLMVANRDGVWPEEPGASLTFELRPQFWQTDWFRALILLGTAAIAVLALRLRDGHLRTRFAVALAERTRLARELHDTLLQGFAGVSWQLQAIVDNMPGQSKVKKDLGHALYRMDECLREARQTIADLREGSPNHGGLDVRLERICEEAGRLGTTLVSFRVVGARRQLSYLAELNLFMVAREALSNALKHAYATQVEVTLQYSHSGVQVSVADNGQGFVVQQAFDGHWGIQGMRERIHGLRGELTIRSAPNEGTEVLASLCENG